jgi:hypothetical protein
MFLKVATTAVGGSPQKGKKGGRTPEALAMARRSNMDDRQRRDVGTETWALISAAGCSAMHG